MKKFIISITPFIICFSITAYSGVVCQSKLTCNYNSGLCNTASGWMIDSSAAVENFSGKKSFNLTEIMGYKEDSHDDHHPFILRCYYSYGYHSVISIYTYVEALTGANWKFSGFGKNKAECSDFKKVNACSGVNQFKKWTRHEKNSRGLSF
ncbi:MAG: hypothetical protein H0U57_12660 [Tatlockia sp.]|nr:hypothetical protein [Tatlockia sp.]